jgi:hypothetical protein
VKIATITNDSQLNEFMYDYIKTSLNQIYFLENKGKLNYLQVSKEQGTLVSMYIESMHTTDLEKSKTLLDFLIHETESFTKCSHKNKKAIGSLHVRNANVLLNLNEPDLALKEYDLAINLIGLKPSILVNKSICLNKLDRTSEAIAYFKKISRINSVSGLIAECNLAQIAFDEDTKISYKLKDPKEYFNLVLKKLTAKSFNQIDNSRFQVSEAVIEGTNSEKCFVFRRASSNIKTKQIFEKEEKALKNFYYSNNELGFNLKVVRPLGIVENIRGYDTIVLTRGMGNTVLEELLNLEKQNKRDEINLLFDNLTQEFVKARLIGNYSCAELTDKLHSEDKQSNMLLYNNLITNKFIGTKDYLGSIYNVVNLKKADEIKLAIEQNYSLISKILAYQNADFYKDMSLKNILISNNSFIHLDFETLRNFPFVLDVATALNMGDFATDKDKIAKNIYYKNIELSSNIKLTSNNYNNLGTLEEFTIALHAAGVQRGLTHHASFTDWHNRIGKEEYKQLAKDSLNNSIKDLIWLKENCIFNLIEKDKITSMYNLFTEIYN